MKIENCLKNFLECRRGDHILFRSFGIGNIDSPYGLSKGEIKAQIAKYYPNLTGVKVTSRNTSDGLALGQYSYTIEFSGYRSNNNG
jgi:hypothetical protein